MKIGVFGGTFNPIHRGHLAAASAAAGVLDLELRRQGASYTCDTLAQLREQYPEEELFLLMGSDMFLSFETWRQPERICDLATLAVFSRREESEAAAFARQKRCLEETYGANIRVLENPEVVEISSTELREKLSRGEGRAYLTEPVYGYILRKGLYGTKADLKHLTPEELRPIALSYLKPKRMPHVLGTEQEAAFLAEKYGADGTAARVAALLQEAGYGPAARPVPPLRHRPGPAGAGEPEAPALQNRRGGGPG